VTHVQEAARSWKPYRLDVLRDHDNMVRLALWQVGYNAHEMPEPPPRKVGSLAGLALTACHAGLVEILRREGYPPSVVVRPQTEPIRLSEDAGIHLSLLFRLTRPLKRVDRIHGILQGLQQMTPDERQYFYARVQYPQKGRYMERALRIWLGHIDM
jgi:hypothetical protein